MRAGLLLLAAPLLLSAADPLALAEREAALAAREQQRLEAAAASARGSAERASADAAAAAQAMLAADARIAASEAALVDLGRRREVLEARLAEARRPAAALLAGLAQLGRRPQWLALADSGGADEQARLAVLVRSLRPEIERRSTALRGEWEALRRLGERQRQLGETLANERGVASTARDRFAALERQSLATADRRAGEAVGAEDRVLERSERLGSLRGEVAARALARTLAGQLTALPAATPRPVAAEKDEGAAAPFAWTVPASGRVTIGLGELLPNGVRARGLTVAASPGTQVVAPAPGRIAFAGPFRRRAGVVIIDHGDGWATLLSEVRPGVRVGDRVARGEAIGRALAPVTAELFRGGTAAPAALIARSS